MRRSLDMKRRIQNPKRTLEAYIDVVADSYLPALRYRVYKIAR